MFELQDSDHIIYLANITTIANLDAVLTPLEVAALDEIRIKIGGKKSSFNSARKAVESHTYTLSKCGDFACQVNNIADMLYISLVDGELSENELSIITKFSDDVGLTSQQLDFMINEATTRINKLTLKVICPKCANESVAQTKFCPNCGTPLSNQIDETVKTDFQIPVNGYTIEFAESTAANFAKAMEIAKAAPVFESCVRMKKTWYLASWSEDSFLEVTKLAQALSGIRNRRYYHNGIEKLWDEVFSFVWCLGQRNISYIPVEYCFGKNMNRLNPWGCWQSNLDWNEWARWFSYGQFRKEGILKNTIIWSFDKDKIRHELMTNIHRFNHCPFIRSELFEAVLKALPDNIEIPPSSGWKYSKIYEEVPGSIKITEVDKSSGFEYKQEYYADGLRPSGLAVLKQVLEKAFTEAKIIDIKVDQLLK